METNKPKFDFRFYLGDIWGLILFLVLFEPVKYVLSVLSLLTTTQLFNLELSKRVEINIGTFSTFISIVICIWIFMIVHKHYKKKHSAKS